MLHIHHRRDFCHDDDDDDDDRTIDDLSGVIN